MVVELFRLSSFLETDGAVAFCKLRFGLAENI